MENQQNELENIMNQINLYKNQGEVIQQQIDTIQVSLNEIEILEVTLEDVQGKNSLNTLVPVGAGSFMEAEINNTDEIIVSVGAGVTIKKNIDDAKKTIAKQKNGLQQNLDKMLFNIEKVNQVISQLSSKAEELMTKTQMGNNLQ
ncbi:MAG: prefoldin subunit alpha [Methanobrevibacter sp.]|jgi:prefoldin alpha subunit|nr:prefoldin subunit alpha [Candidatus Methanovirga basalitermitum]